MVWARSSGQKGSNATHRVFANLQARYTIVGSTDGGHSPEVRSCVTRTIALDRIVLQDSVPPPIGTILHLSIATLGAWSARTSEHLPTGFAAVPQVRAAEADKLARRLDWLRRLNNHEAKNRRRHQRFALPPLAVELLTVNGGRIPATLFDLSSSGIGVQTPARLPLDTPVQINGIPARVARYFDGGMGIRFEATYSIEELRQKLLPRPASS